MVDGMIVRKFIKFVSKNKIFHLFLGSVTIMSGINEVWETIFDDIISGNIHSGHGVIFIGIWHCARSLSEFVEASDYLNEGLE